MALFLVQATLGVAQGDPADWVSNSFWFDGGAGDQQNLLDMVDDFYTGEVAGKRGLRDALGGVDFLEIKTYNHSDPKPRAPVATRYKTLGGIAAPYSGPPQLSVVLSYEADPLSGVPRARRRGRLFLGPINMIYTEERYIPPALRNKVTEAATALVQASDASVSWSWVVHSRASGSNSVIRTGWVDNSWDVMRSRKWPATIRQLWPIIG